VIAHKTFARRDGMTAKSILEAQEEIRAQAEAFMAREIDADDVINVTESSLILPLTNWSLFSVTVWYRKRQV
jgi:hypothetical protein